MQFLFHSSAAPAHCIATSVTDQFGSVTFGRRSLRQPGFNVSSLFFVEFQTDLGQFTLAVDIRGLEQRAQIGSMNTESTAGGLLRHAEFVTLREL